MFVVKTGLFDYRDKTDGTMIYLERGDIKIEHQHINKYNIRKNKLNDQWGSHERKQNTCMGYDSIGYCL